MTFAKQLYKGKEAQYYQYEREDMLKFVPTGTKSVLDIGCSSGGFGRLIKNNFGCEVWGVEPDAAAIQAADVLDRVFHQPFDSSIDFGGKKFDLIVFNDVLEHLIDPWQTLSHAKSLLSQGGRILASIPNVQCYTVVKKLVFNGTFQYESSGILDKTHLRFFTKKSIRDLFEQCGLDVELIEGMHSVAPYSRLLRIVNSIAPSKADPFLYVSYAVLSQPIKS